MRRHRFGKLFNVRRMKIERKNSKWFVMRHHPDFVFFCRIYCVRKKRFGWWNNSYPPKYRKLIKKGA